MVKWKKSALRIPRRARLAGGAIALLALGGAAGASAVSHMRPSVEMAPAMPTAIAKVPQATGVVTVKGKIAEIYGDRFIMQDGSGRLLIDAGPGGSSELHAGSALMAQGRYDDGQFHASYLVDPQGRVTDVGAHPHPPHGPGHEGPPPPHGPGHDGPPPPNGAGPTPPPPGGMGVPPPPPPVGDAGARPVPGAPLPIEANGVPRNVQPENPQLPVVHSATK